MQSDTARELPAAGPPGLGHRRSRAEPKRAPGRGRAPGGAEPPAPREAVEEGRGAGILARALAHPSAPPVAAALIGFAWYLALGGGPTLDPRNVGWLLRGGDASQRWLGWAFFRNAPWQLPLGALPDLLHPVGTSVALTDGIPWLALLLRPFSRFMPAEVQFLGPWLAGCFALQGFFGARLVSTVDRRPSVQLLGGALFALSPLLPQRIGQDSLCAQWLVLAMLWLYLRPAPDQRLAWRAAVAGALLTVFAAGVSVYLAAMVAALLVALLAREVAEGALGGYVAASLLLAAGAGIAAVWLVLGLLPAPSSGRGFGYFSADLLTFVNPMGWSRLLPPLPAGPGQYEGFGYLGAGVLALAPAGLLAALARRGRLPGGWRRWGPLAAAVTLLTLYALSGKWTLLGHRLLGASGAHAPLRSSGRLIWPLHDLVILGAVAGAVRLGARRRAAAPLALAAACGLQLADLRTAEASASLGGRTPPLAPEWSFVAGRVRHLVAYPPQLVDGDFWYCGEDEGSERLVKHDRIAARHRLTINSAYVARVDAARAREVCAQAGDEVARGRLRDDALYLVHPARLGDLPASAACGAVDGEIACVSASGDPALRAWLAQRPLSRRPRQGRTGAARPPTGTR